MGPEWRVLEEACRELKVELPAEAIRRLALYRRAIVEWNERVNLVSRRDTGRLVGYHFLDSVEGFVYLRESDREVLDLGSGGGLPGLVWKILNPGLAVTLLDSIRKRCLFLEKVVSGLGLVGTAVVRSRAESLAGGGEYADRFDVAAARTVARLGRVVELAFPLVRPGGRLLAYKGRALREELREAEDVIREWGGWVSQVAPARSPTLRGKRTFVVVEKGSG